MDKNIEKLHKKIMSQIHTQKKNLS